MLDGTELENVLGYTYLGSEFEADGDTRRAVSIMQDGNRNATVWKLHEYLES